MDDFHMVMAESFHPYKDSANLKPAKEKAPELAASASAWKDSAFPEGVSKEKVKDKLDRPPVALDAVYEALKSTFDGAQVDTQDGLRLSWPDSWVHIRPSGTEPIVRVIAEAPSEVEARALVARSREPLDALAG